MKKNISGKTFLFIDGSNLYAGQYALFGPKKYLVFSRLIKQIEKRLKVKFNKIYFYASYSPKPAKSNKKQKQFLINEFQFYKDIKTIKSLKFIKGKRSKTSGKEKGVDVALCADIMRFAYENKYSKAFVFTGDADFLYALKIISKLKKVNILCLENRIAYPMSYFFKLYVLLLKNQNFSLKTKIRAELIKINPTCSDVG